MSQNEENDLGKKMGDAAKAMGDATASVTEAVADAGNNVNQTMAQAAGGMAKTMGEAAGNMIESTVNVTQGAAQSVGLLGREGDEEDSVEPTVAPVTTDVPLAAGGETLLSDRRDTGANI